jgi:hypothetical protein
MATYTAVKPTICPKCKEPFSAAFKTVTAAMVDEAMGTTNLRRVSTPTAPRRSSLRPPPPRNPARETDASATRPPSYMVPLDGSDLPGFAPPELEDPTEGLDDKGPVDKEEVSIYAAELQASLDPSTIRIDFGDTPIRLHSIIPPEARR